MKSIITVILVLTVGNTFAQRFWLTTRDFPGDIKNGIILVNDTTLLVALENAIALSTNDGYSWDTVFVGQQIKTLFKSSTNRIFVGAYAKIYYTDNLLQWDSVSLPIQSNVAQFCELNQQLYFISNSFSIVDGYYGNGVFKSDVNGIDWMALNNGLNSNQNVQFITKDKHGRLYIAINDNYVSESAGLYRLNTISNVWEKLDISFDGRNTINPNNIRVAYFKGLTYLNNDSLFISVDGVAVNVALSVNLVKHIDDLGNASNWNVIKVSSSNMWFADQLLAGIHVSGNGHWYSSITGSKNVGGSMYSSNAGGSWLRHQYGLGTDLSGRFNVQKFAEKSDGKIFMIQLGDARVYWTDKSLNTGMPTEEYTQVLVYPNPLASNAEGYIFVDTEMEKHIQIFNLHGIKVHEQTSVDKRIKLPFLVTGVYIVCVQYSTNVLKTKLVVN